MQMNQPIRMTRTVLMVVALLFCFTAVAAAQSAQKIDACTLLTKAQIQAAVGQNVGDGKLNASIFTKAVNATTGLTVCKASLIQTLHRYANAYHVKADSSIGQLLRAKRGAPKGSCLGVVRNQWGRGGKPVAA
jgi:hypothetical protein